MARLAIPGDTECRRTVVAGAAGLTILHLGHGRLVHAALGLEQVGVAVFAAKQGNVRGVREGDVAGIFLDVEDVAGMAGDAVALDTESALAVMAGPAGLAPLHRFHADVAAVAFLLEEFRMARVASGTMHGMAENHIANGFGLHGNFIHHTHHATHTPHAPHLNGGQDSRQSNDEQNDQHPGS